MNPFLDAVTAQIETRPGDVFCHFLRRGSRRAIHWGEFGRKAGAFAAAYRAQGLPPGAIVAIFLRHDPSLYAAFIGAMAAGLVPTILACPSPRQDPAIYWDSLRRLLAHLDPGAIVLDGKSRAELEAAGLAAASRAIAVEEVPSDGAWPVELPGIDALALVQHSSGTTGLKKGVALSYRAIAAQLDAYAAALHLQPEDRIVSWLPLYHDMGLIACFLLPTYRGIPFIHVDAFEWVARPVLLLEAIASYRGTLVWQPDFAFAHMARAVPAAARFDLSSMRAFISCAEPCRPESFAAFLARFAGSGVTPAMLQCCYAMAETVFAVSQSELGQPPRTAMIGKPPRPALNLGRPLPGIEVAIRARDGRRCGEGEVGEITLKGDFLMQGYFRNPGLTADRLRAGWYWSRDLGTQIAGELYVLGRRDDMLIVQGRNLHAGEVEGLVGTLGLTRPGRAVAFTLYDERQGGNGLVVLAERAADGTLDDDAITGGIARHIRSLLDIQPREVTLVPAGWIVKTTSGKVSREANRRKYLAHRDTAAVEAALAGA